MSWEQLGDFLGRAQCAPSPVFRPLRQPVKAIDPTSHAASLVRYDQPVRGRRLRPVRGAAVTMLSDFSADLRAARATVTAKPVKTTATKKTTAAKKNVVVKVDPQQSRVMELRSKYPSYVFKGTEFLYAATAENQLTNAFSNTASSARSGLAGTSLRVLDVQAPQGVTDAFYGTRVTITVATTEDHTDVLHVRSIIEGALYKGGLKNFNNVEFRVTAEPEFVQSVGSSLASQPGANVKPIVPSRPKIDPSDPDSKPGSNTSGFVESLGMGLGLSTPMAAVAAAAGLFLFVKFAK